SRFLFARVNPIFLSSLSMDISGTPRDRNFSPFSIYFVMCHFGLARRVRPSLPERSPWGTVLWVRRIREPVFALRVIVKLVTRIFSYTEYPFLDPAKRVGRLTALEWIWFTLSRRVCKRALARS